MQTVVRQVVWFLPIVTRGLAICALLVGLAAGLSVVVLGAGTICVDSCPTRDFYFSHLGPGTVQFMTPCVGLAVLAVVAFVAYCLATRQGRRATLVLIVLGVVGLVGGVALDVLIRHAQATLPSGSQSDGGILLEGPLEAWDSQLGWALTLVAGAWSGLLAFLQWRR